MTVDPGASDVFLSNGGASQVVPGGADVRALQEAAIETYGHGWRVSETSYTAD
jgi:hypothetical protein